VASYRAGSSGPLGNLGRDPPRLILREKLGRRSPVVFIRTPQTYLFRRPAAERPGKSPFARLYQVPAVKLNLPARTFPALIVSNLAMTTAQSIELTCPDCDGTMSLIRRIDLKEMPEIYIFYCERCQRAETVKQERTVCETSGRELVDAD
jgi:hypothetical protein